MDDNIIRDRERRIRAELLDWLRDVRAYIRSEGIAETDVRLALRPDGSTDFLSGDPCYDTDHRGAWGCGLITDGDDDAELEDMARDMVEDALSEAHGLAENG